MTELLIRGGRVVTGDGVLDPGWVRVLDGRIAAVGAGAPPPTDAEPLDATGQWVLPGFVDVHCHGGGGAAFTTGRRADVERAVHAHRAHGSTTVVASLVSRPVPELADRIRDLAALADEGLVHGVHLEGPFLAAARCGAHDPAVLCDPDLDSVRTLLDAGRGHVRMVTLAPERTGAVDAVKLLADEGVLAAVGHTDATYAQVRPVLDAGATVATHLFNGMRPLHHREPGPVGALLDDDRVTVELICDLVHLHPAVLAMAARHAGTGRTVLITDAIAAAAAADGEYDIGGLPVTVRDGVPTLAGGSLAGSTLTMDAALRNLVTGCGLDLVTAAHATATRPAQLLGIAGDTGSIAPGLAADLVLLDDALHPVAVLRRGAWVHRAGLPVG